MFKNKKLLLVVAVAMAATLLLAGTASAGPATVLIHTDGCMVIDLAGNIVPVEGNASGDGPIILTNNKKGIWHISCHGTLPASSPRPEKAVVLYPEGLCGVPGLTPEPTSDIKLVFTPSGHVTLNCYFGSRDLANK